jgi:hypothetical protein
MKLGNKTLIILSFLPFVSFIFFLITLGSNIIKFEPMNPHNDEVGLALIGFSIFLPFAVLQYLNPREVGGIFGYGIFYYSKDKEESLKKMGLILIVIILILYAIGLILFLF